MTDYNVKNYGKDFLRTWDKDIKSILTTQKLASFLRERYYKDIQTKKFDSGIAISIFKDNSTRTKYSYAAASNYLGLEVEQLDEQTSQIAHGETVLETVNMISFLTKFIGIRDDKFLGIGHNYQCEVVDALQKGYEEGTLAQRPGVINLQSDEDHPTQSISDMCHLVNYFGGIKKLKGKNITISWTYSPSYGKPMSVPQGLIALLPRLGMNVTLAYPKGYNLIPRIEKYAKRQADTNGSKFKITHDMREAFRGADVVYPKSWAAYRFMVERTKLLKNNNNNGLTELEKQTLRDASQYKSWTYDSKMMNLTKDSSALYMHCLPADISGINCEAGEVSYNVFKKHRKDTYIQASYKPFVIAAMMLLMSQKAIV